MKTLITFILLSIILTINSFSQVIEGTSNPYEWFQSQPTKRFTEVPNITFKTSNGGSEFPTDSVVKIYNKDTKTITAYFIKPQKNVQKNWKYFRVEYFNDVSGTYVDKTTIMSQFINIKNIRFFNADLQEVGSKDLVYGIQIAYGNGSVSTNIINKVQVVFYLDPTDTLTSYGNGYALGLSECSVNPIADTLVSNRKTFTLDIEKDTIITKSKRSILTTYKDSVVLVDKKTIYTYLDSTIITTTYSQFITFIDSTINTYVDSAFVSSSKDTLLFITSYTGTYHKPAAFAVYTTTIDTLIRSFLIDTEVIPIDTTTVTPPTDIFDVIKDRGDDNLNQNKIYPNPVSIGENITIEYDNFKVVYVYDMTGKLIKAFSENIINTSDLKAGNYIFKIVNNDNVTDTKKIVIFN